jgi:hypothetical protein
VSARARLAGYLVLLSSVFAGAMLAGGAIDPGTVGDDTAAAHSTSSGTTGHGAAESHGAGSADTPAPQAVRGLAVSDSGLTLELVDRTAPRDRATRIAFRVTRRDGSAQTRFDVAHEKRMHLIVVRRDGRGFQHLHPAMTAEGDWSTSVALSLPGLYRVFADFTVEGRAHTLAADLAVDGNARYGEFPEPAPVAPAGQGYQVRLDNDPVRAGRETELRFSVAKGSRTVKTEPYLGAGGHLVALRRGDLAYLHTHPSSHGAREGGSAVTFESTFPSAGAYRLYFQFQHDGRVRTAEFTQEVTR